ncbi:hypothetical protein SATMO3_18370 [Sporomusa aerivorans]
MSEKQVNHLANEKSPYLFFRTTGHGAVQSFGAECRKFTVLGDLKTFVK